MAPLHPSPSSSSFFSTSPQSRNMRRCLHEAAAAAGGGGGGNRRVTSAAPPHRSSSFNGRSSAQAISPSHHKQIPRPKTQPELLRPAWRSTTSSSSTSTSTSSETERRVPSKILVNVNFQRSLGALQVMASKEWTVKDLVAASIKQYVKEGRRPLLPTADPSDFDLHYSQFSFECLDPTEKLVGLGSRNFFLCSKSAAAPSSAVDNEAAPTVSSVSSSCSNQAEKASKFTIPWLRFVLKSLPSA